MEIDDFIETKIKEIKDFFCNEVAMSKIDTNGIHYIRGKIDFLDDLIHNSSYDAHRDLDGFSVQIGELSTEIQKLSNF